MVRRDVNYIIAQGTEDELRECLTEAKRLCKEGKVLELFDHLVPEDARKVTVQDGTRRRIIRR